MKDVEYTYTCIKKLNEYGNYFDRWHTLKNIYKPQLDTDVFVDDAQYTPHDYSRHCKNIYKILDIILSEESYEKSITTEQLFYLNVSVLMHDIAMVAFPQKRFNHSEEAKKYILKEVLGRNATLSLLLSPEEASFIAEIIYAHSDIKDDDGKTTIPTLQTLPDGNFKNGIMGPINTKMLAGLLRLSDELDINSWRVSGKDLIHFRIGEKSLIHWKKCELFGFPSRDDRDKTIILLRLNEDTIKMKGDIENDVKLIIDVESKIIKEFDLINTTVFNSGCLSGWIFTKIKIYTEDQEISEKICKAHGYKNPLSSCTIDISSEETEYPVEVATDCTSKVEIISEKFSEKLKNWVVAGNLLHDGHYYIDKSRYSRDWIDTNSILTNPSYLQDLTDIFYLYLSEIDSYKDLTIIGEGFPGIILASSLAFKSGLPLSYHIPSKHDNFHIDPEKYIKLNAISKVVIVTDVIVTGKTIDKTIETLINNYGISPDNIVRVLCVFYRHPTSRNIKLIPKIAQKITCINSSMPIEICNKNNCLFQEFGLVKHKYNPTT